MKAILKSNVGEYHKMVSIEKVRVRKIARLTQVHGLVNSALKESEMREYAKDLLNSLEKLKEEL